MKSARKVIRQNLLAKATRARVADTLNRIVIPRFVEGPIKDSWKLLAPLERLNPATSIVRPIYFWFTALAEPLAYDFCTEYLAALRADGVRFVNVNDASAWIARMGNNWSASVVIKVTRALLAALRDFGILEGKAHKYIAPPRLPVRPFAFIAFCLHRNGVPAREMATHPDWKIFLLAPDDVERSFFEAHQEGLLEYYAAGSVVRLTFPASTAEEYAHVVVGR